MEISRKLNLNKTQPELDFTDIDIDCDTKIFLDPYLLGSRTRNPWCNEASNIIKNYFQLLISSIKEKNDLVSLNLLTHLGEPNETCLGLSTGNPRGRGVGSGDSQKLLHSLKQSKAVQTGLVEDLEDCRIFIEGIDKDKISDMTTAIIRKKLIEYTQQQCKLNGIPLKSGTPSGFFWDPDLAQWRVEHTDMLAIDGNIYLLVPKSVVSFASDYTPHEYYSKYVLEYHKNDLRTIRPVLIQHRNDGTPFVTKKALRGEFPYSKEFLLHFSGQHPDIFNSFKQEQKSKQQLVGNTLSPTDIVSLAKSLIEQLRNIPTGVDYATTYHRLMAGILEFVFYPQLQYPCIEKEINEGRKRIDIVYR